MSALRKPNSVAPAATEPADDISRLRQRLIQEPGLFEPSTAFRLAVEDADVHITSPFGVAPASVPVVLDQGRNGAIAATPVSGLIGPLGVLPPSYDEAVMREERNRSHALLAFFDVFGARLAALFFAAAEKYRLARRLRWGGRGAGNAFLTALFSLTGFGTRGLKETSGLDTDVILRFAGFFAQRTRNASNLRAMLADFTGLPVKIEQFRPRWLTVAEHDRTALGPTARLGVNTMAGTAVRDRSSGFRIVLGPLDYRDYCAFAPGGAAARELVALTRLFVGIGLTFDVQVVLKKEQVPFCQLGGAGAAQPRLGWNSWARVAPAARDSDEAFYTAEAGEKGASHAA
ncbi:type VI secretion system baseplate subunit TssG [Afifella sp. H1R]|uniref:type VI secretion system baseplate subunit TssG n=1 Tax=Afifella sp. H1R TaxID=2908841 RepID=UPI001F1AB301|nr:type VI secretion system baseplate subunit TssG [Afifella sp. H1R]MCF1505957.1 type VI secretion system baseplate subunit TssG [Afifella sp. H1R]